VAPAPTGATGTVPLTLGTAGHIDHGKTALIRTLTGTDTDRLAEERRRGISIELGYAALTLPSGRRVSVIDVPGHERFVRTMVAGASGIDFFVMVIAADDGVMPQTREHAAVLEGLGVVDGVVAVTKADIADPAPALAEAQALLPEAPAVAVSVRTGAGLKELCGALDRLAAALPGRGREDGPTRLHIDRVFTITGAGTVVTGTLWSGQIVRGEELVILPAARRVRVRAVQVHDDAVPSAAAGQRVAVNLTGVSRRELSRGDVLTKPGADLRASFVIDVALPAGAAAKPPADRERVQVHHGTREAAARLTWLGGRFWQLRVEQPLLAAAGDRVILRRIAPPDTLTGALVLDPRARRHGPAREHTARLQRRLRGEPEPAPGPAVSPPPGPARAGAPAPLSARALALESRLREAWLTPPSIAQLSEAEIAELPALRAAGRAVRLGRALHYHPDALDEARRRVEQVIAREGAITLAGLRDELGASRRFAQALLEHLDAERVTRRLPGDERVLRKPR
jgi:selenocysteine-specific elongation factor